MGEIATTVVKNGSRVIGVIPRYLVEKEVAFTNPPDLRIVDSMHEWKALMADLADGFVALLVISYYFQTSHTFLFNTEQSYHIGC